MARKNGKTIERRHRKRFPIHLPIKWKKSGSSSDNISEAFLLDAKNIASSGLFLRTQIKPKKGSYIELILDPNNGSKPFTLRGRVAWVASKKKHPYLYPGLGIKFLVMSHSTYRQFSNFIKYKVANYNDAKKLKDMYQRLKDMASSLVELEEKHLSATHFKKVIDNAISEIDNVAHMLDKEINEVRNL